MLHIFADGATYQKKTEPKQVRRYSPEDLMKAIMLVKARDSCKRVSQLLHSRHRTLRDRISGKRTTLEIGRKPAVFPQEELSIAQHLATFSDYGYAFYQIDLGLFAKSF